MVSKDLLKEIRFIAICSLCMNIVLIAVASLFVPFVNALCGALFGTVLLVADLFFISLSVRDIVSGARRGKDGSAKMVFHYLLRYLFLAAGLYLALVLPFSSVICAAIPLFYPKVIYLLKATLVKKEG